MKTVEVLVVDDDALTTTVLNKLLTKAGYQVTISKNGVTALKRLRQDSERFRVIILDHIMPLMSGLDLLHKLSADQILMKIPVIMLTSKSERSDKSAAYTAGVFDFLPKPIDAELLRMVIKRAVDKYQLINK